MQELFSILPTCIPFPRTAVLLGIFFAVLIRFRGELADFLISIKDRSYRGRDLAILLGIPSYAVGAVFASFIPYDFSFWIVFILSLYLLIDGLLDVGLEREVKPRDIDLQEGTAFPFLQGLFLPHLSSASFLLPAFLVKNVQWKDAVFVSFMVSFVYLSGGFISPLAAKIFLPIVVSFLISIVLLSLYYHLDELVPYPVIKVIYGFTTLLLCSLTRL